MSPLTLAVAILGGEVVDWSAPPECAQAAAVRAALVDHLGRDVAQGELSITGTVVRDGDGYRLDRQTDVGDGRDARVLRDVSCDALAKAAGVIGTATLRASVPEPSVPPPSKPEVAVNSAPAPATPAPRPNPVVPPAPPLEPSVPRSEPGEPSARTGRVRLSVGADAGVEIAALPAPSAIVHMLFAVDGAAVRGELAGTYASPQTESTAQGSVLVQLGAVAGRACWKPPAGPVEAPICVGVEVGAMRGDGRVVSGSRTAHGLWVAPTVSGAVLWWWHPRVALRGGLEVAAAVVRPQFELVEPGPTRVLFTAGAITGRAVAGIEVRIAGSVTDRRAGRRSRKKARTP